MKLLISEIPLYVFSIISNVLIFLMLYEIIELFVIKGIVAININKFSIFVSFNSINRL